MSGEGELLINVELIDLKAKGQPKLNIATFGEDVAGELYIGVFGGRIHLSVRRP